jgi:hypothetical protein
MSPLPKDRTVWLPATFYPVDIAFIPDKVSWDIQMKRLRKTLGEATWAEVGGAYVTYPASKGAMTYVHIDGIRPSYFVTLSKGAELAAEYEVFDTLAHEATHIKQRIFEWIEEEEYGYETEAYLIGFLVRHLYLAFLKTRVLDEEPSDPVD